MTAIVLQQTGPMRAMWLLILSLCAAFGVAFSVAAKPVSAADDDAIYYTMQRGDSLIRIADRHFINPKNYTQVQRLNAIKNPRAIATGRIIRIPRDLLKFRPIAISLASFRGPVTVNNAAARATMAVDEGATIRTGAQGFASLSFDNGRRVALPSNSALIIRRARVLLIDNSRDVEIELVSGGMRSRVQPFTNAGDRDRVRTRHSVTAVRGTEFGTAVGDDNNVVLSEVYEGGIALNPADATDIAALIPAGTGVKLSADGARITAALLPSPELANPGKVQNGADLQFAITHSALDTAAFRVEIATDAGFVDQVFDARFLEPNITIPAPEDGRYYLRLSAIDANGLVGIPVTHAFRRIQSGASASTAVDADGYLFRWQTFGARTPDVRFRLFSGDMTGTPMIDEPALTGGQLRISDLKPGTYVWQIGTRLVDDGDVIESWGQPETLIVSP